MNKTSHSLTSPGFNQDNFAYRHLGLNDSDRRHMLDTIGLSSVEDLLDQTIPKSIRMATALAVPEALGEEVVLEVLKQKFAKDKQRISLIGQGYYNTITPSVLRRNMIENPSWYTAYTPYQPEISQGRLEALLNFQTMISEIVALPLANASLLDEATAVAEAVTMAHRTTKNSSDAVLVDRNIHPQTLSVLKTRLQPIGLTIELADVSNMQPGNHFAVLISWPGSNGVLPDVFEVERVVNAAHANQALMIAVCDLLACTIVVPPGEMNFDIAVGSSQRFGVPMGFGGPHAAFMATRLEYARSLPGRLVGVSTDTQGRPALRLTLQTREQHIRREKATSNICTAQVLLANVAGMFGVWHGPDGLALIANRVHLLTTATAEALQKAGHVIRSEKFFDTVSVEVPNAQTTHSYLQQNGFNVRIVDDNTIAFSCDETTTPATMQGFALLWGATLQTEVSSPLDEHRRSSEFMTQSVFHKYRSEHEMLRYLRSLADKDLALDRTMIPLGSCTMKLNSTTEMEPVTWPEFAALHPFAPEDETTGIRSVITELEEMLISITGYDAISLQPNAGSQGEFAGLLAIRDFHQSRGDSQRTICLIPSSAHGTNAASAVMAGMNVVVVKCDDEGNIDTVDLLNKAQSAGNRLAAVMITYPSTHGVFEESVREICAIIHDHGGQVYVDGANMNALVGTAQPGRFGADVSHLNLHKTFCIPHGGGGPGVGPVVVRKHLAPFLPGDPRDLTSTRPAISAAPFGSASILAIPWVYIMMMGPSGLLQATADAILSANYMAIRLHDSFPILYRGNNSRVAHECILDVGSVVANTGLSVDDVAKRLMDYGFHAPTMSFPVANTLMVEPTESEALTEIDRFCESMISIRSEIDSIVANSVPVQDCVLRHSPHTIEDIAEQWDRPYSRQQALFPLPWLRNRHYHPPVSRIDAAFGDRNIVCTCAPIEAYSQSLETDTVSV